MMKLFCPILLLLASIIFIHSAWAKGFRVIFPEVVLEDLKIGRTYNISEIKGKKILTVKSRDEKTIKIKVEPITPLEKEMKEGYEAVPDVSWIKVRQDAFSLRPQEKAIADINVSIPDKGKYLGKKYQAMIRWRYHQAGLVNEIKSLILLHINEKEEETVVPATRLSARPGRYLFSGISVGKKYELPLPLRIENKSDKDRTYLLSTYKQPQKSGSKQVEGYSEILDPHWLFFERDEITIESDGINEVKMYSKVPDNDSYYNQHWAVGLGIEGKPEEGEAVNLAVYPQYFLETESKGDLSAKPYGPTGIKPSVVTLNDVPLGKIERTAQIEIFNNDHINNDYSLLQYKITSEVPAKDSDKRILVSPSYSWIPDPNWIIPEQKELTIDEGKSETLEVGLNIPQEDKNRGKKWEGLLMIRPDQGQPRFVRIQISTKR